MWRMLILWSSVFQARWRAPVKTCGGKVSATSFNLTLFASNTSHIIRAIILPLNIPFTLIVFGVGEPIAHYMNLPPILGMYEGALFINPYPIVLPGKINYQR